MASIQGSDIKSVIVACEAGMGSSVLLTTQLRQRLAPYGVEVEHLAVNRIEGRPDVIVCHVGLEARARQQAPDSVVLPFNMFMGDPAFDRLEQAIRDGEALTS
ncbi:MAG: PTS lactose transporter subunit IIB [Actinobacteria bacterium]|nr:PTS lactose transporter subunit IIB [Actinomycetota bacterium]